MRSTSELVLDEFEKVQAIEKRADEALAKADAGAEGAARSTRPPDGPPTRRGLPARAHDAAPAARAADHAEGASATSTSRASRRLEKEVVARFDEVSTRASTFFQKGEAFQPLVDRGSTALLGAAGASTRPRSWRRSPRSIDVVRQGLTLLAEVVGGLKIDDPRRARAILEGISELFCAAEPRRARARRRSARSCPASEGRAEFGAQFRLLRPERSTGALALCDTPEKCDEQLSQAAPRSSRSSRAGSASSTSSSAELAAEARRGQRAVRRAQAGAARRAPAPRAEPGAARRSASSQGVAAPREDVQGRRRAERLLRVRRDGPQAAASSPSSSRARRHACAPTRSQSRLKSARQDALRALRDKPSCSRAARTSSARPAPLQRQHPAAGADARAARRRDVPPPHRHRLLRADRGSRARWSAAELWDQTLVSETPAVYRARVPGRVHAARRGGGQGRPHARGAHEAGARRASSWSACARTRRSASTRATSAASTTPTRR